MKKIFVDMDGVLTDFNSGYKLINGRSPSEVKNSKIKGEYALCWDKFVDQDGFEILGWNPGGPDLIAALMLLDRKKYQVCILSSAGGFHRQLTVMRQKIKWLEDHMIEFPAVVVPGRRYKSGFADKDSLIIDDTFDTTLSFREQGGSAIHHQHDMNATIVALNMWLASNDRN